MDMGNVSQLQKEKNQILRRMGSRRMNLVTDTAAHQLSFSPGNTTPVLKERQTRGISFLDLPLEIRLMVYRYCLIAIAKTIKPPSKMDQYYAVWATPTLDKTDEQIKATIRKHRANHPSYVPFPQSYTGLRDPSTGLLTLEVSLLRLNKKIHAEAASVLYGDNLFQFVLAITRRHPGVKASEVYKPPYYDFRDNLTVVSEKYMKVIRQCTVEVRLPNFPWTRAKEMYLQYYARLAAFANCFGGDDHSMQKVAIYFNRCFKSGYYFPVSCLRTSQNVLETLAAIHSVKMSVAVGGVTPAFEAKLSLAMMSKAIAWVPRQEEYGRRMVKYKGKRRSQRYKLRSYYDSNKVWSQSALGPYPPHSRKAPPVYECCEVCDTKKPLKFPPFYRPL